MNDLTAEELFVFVGAGASMSPPSSLAIFDPIRDDALRQLKLGEHLRSAGENEVRSVDDLSPEPFMLALARNGVDVVRWLGDVLSGGKPNAAHHLLACLATNGARVWTVNFDTLIEQAGGRLLRTVSWPDELSREATLVKAHGSLGGELIVTAEQVLAGLSPTWEARLREDARGRTALFLGYSGRDLDLQPLWSDVLREAPQIIWFDRPDDQRRAHKQQLLTEAWRDGRLVFPEPARPPVGVSPDAPPNPSWDFVSWCHERRLNDVDPGSARQLFEPRPAQVFPPLPRRGSLARGAIRGLLGDERGARRAFALAVVSSGHPLVAARRLVETELQNGGRGMAALLRAHRLVPRVGRLGQLRARLECVRLTVLSKSGDHERVLRGTQDLPDDAVSTLLILRCESLRMARSLNEAVTVGQVALARSIDEQHPVRAAHAAFQLALALVWSERLDEARRYVDERLRPLASVAALRWQAWADFVDGQIATRDHDGLAADRLFHLSASRFRVEGLVDGELSALVAHLTAHRLVANMAAFDTTLRSVSVLRGQRLGKARYYARGHRFTDDAIRLERAERSRVHDGDITSAWALYGLVAQSPYPIHAALGHLGLAMIEVETEGGLEHAHAARRLSRVIGAGLVAARVDALYGVPAGMRPAELFFC